MGACDKPDLSERVMCCPGKIQLIVLGVIFFVFSLASAGVLYWQVSAYSNEVGSNPDDVKGMYFYMVIPVCMLLSAMCLMAMLKINPKMCLMICIGWPVLSSALPGYMMYISYEGYQRLIESKLINAVGFQSTYLNIFYVVTGSSAVYIIASIYFIMLLVCLGCCDRAGAGQEKDDLYRLESDNRDESQSSSKSRLE